MRRGMLARRRLIHSERGPASAAALRDRVLAALPQASQIIAGYWPLGDELDCRPALGGLCARGCGVALPVVAGQGLVLIFRRWLEGEPMESGPFGTSHPSPRAPVVEPDTLLLPLIAFDRRGHRLGYGAGYYDRTVGALRRQRSIRTIGLAYDEQEVDMVPAAAHDQAMDGVITDRRTLWFPASK
ncbi:MAG: 5-formyltetrahydrofolate cyclo-ligase [Candidatus Binataceae bacterium]